MEDQYMGYDPITGNVTDGTGCVLYTCAGLTPVKMVQKGTSIDDMIKLKNSGFTAEEVIAIKKANL